MPRPKKKKPKKGERLVAQGEGWFQILETKSGRYLRMDLTEYKTEAEIIAEIKAQK